MVRNPLGRAGYITAQQKQEVLQKKIVENKSYSTVVKETGISLEIVRYYVRRYKQGKLELKERI